MNEATNLLCILAVLLAFGQSSPLPAPVCLKALAPPKALLGANQIDGKPNDPRFRLHFSKHIINKGRKDSRQAYKVHVTAMVSGVAYSDAKISMESTGTCGVGTLTYDSDHFFQARQQNATCPELYLTSSKTPMAELPSLVWTPPECGCVLFRALVIEEGTEYFAEREGVQKGPLAQLICVNKATREQHLNALCQILDRYLVKEILSSDFFLARHRLKDRPVDWYQLDLAIKLRRSDARVCCTKESLSKRTECFDEIKWRRVDEFCEDGVPDIPFSVHRMVHMRRKERECCFIFGEYRYSCFEKGSRDSQSVPGSIALDYSLDEMDPANDVAVFASEKDQDMMSMLSPLSLDMGINSPIPEVTIQEVKSEPQTGQAEHDSDDIQSKKIMKTTTHRSKSRKLHKKIAAEDVPEKSGAQGLSTVKTSSANLTTPSRHGFPPSLPSVHPGESRGVPTQETLTRAEIRRLKLLSRDLDRHKDTIGPGSLRGKSSRKLASAEKRRGLRPGSERKTARRTSVERSALRQNSRELPGGYPDDVWSSQHLVPYNPEYLVTPGRQYSSEQVLSLVRNLQGGLSRRFSSAERRRKNGVHGGFDDQGKMSVDKTLNKLERRGQRLRLKQQCCKSGGHAGEFVYGDFTNAWTECTHSAEKWVERQAIRSGHKVCREQFKKCCVESSISGPTLTSQEFKDAEDVYLHNQKRLTSSEVGAVLARRGQSTTGFRRQPALPAELDDGVTESPNGMGEDGGRRLVGVRDPREGEILHEEFRGPRRFDEIDNEMASKYDPLDRRGAMGEEEKEKKNMKEEEGKSHKKQKQREEVKDEDDEEDEDEDEKFERELGIVGVVTVDGKEIPRKAMALDGKENATNSPKKALSKSAAPSKEGAETKKAVTREGEVKTTQGKKTQRDDIEIKDAVSTTDFDAQALDLLARSGTERSTSRSHNTSKTRRRGRKRGGSSRRGGRSRSRSRSREGRRRSSARRSRKSSKERGHRAGHHQQERHNRQGSKFAPFTGVAKDSHEMAALNERRMNGAMDSKEMADVYSRGTLDRAMRDRAAFKARRFYRE